MKTIRRLEITYDECPVDPRTDYEPMCTIASVSGKGKGKGYCDEVRTIEELNDIRTSDAYISKPVYIYSHSGIALSLTPFNDKFDSGIRKMTLNPLQFSIEKLNKVRIPSYFNSRKGFFLFLPSLITRLISNPILK